MFEKRTRTCFICGKEFIKAQDHIFKMRAGGKLRYLCGWNCMRKLEKEMGIYDPDDPD